jgi:endonuclease YncB( thermonuclease family)
LDADISEVNGIPVRLAALDCPERNTKDGDYATELVTQFQGLQATCEVADAKTYDQLVGYCSINDADFNADMMQNSAYKVREKYDVWNRC